MEALSGLLATVITDGVLSPIECIKTWQQGSLHPVGFFASARQLHRNGGALAFWAGAYPFFIFNALGGALKFGIYEPLRRCLKPLLRAQVAEAGRCGAHHTG